MPIRPKTPGCIEHGIEGDEKQAHGSTSAQVETNLAGSMLKISVGSQEVWLNRDEALEVLGLLPGAINQMPFEI